MIYILGERPGPNTDPRVALYPHTNTGAAARLHRLLSLTKEAYLANTSRLNAVDDKSSTASTVARQRVEEFLQTAGQNPFIVLGKSAIRAMPAKYRKMQFGDVVDNVLLIPHTSGVNRVWNDPVFSARMQETARGFVHAKRNDGAAGDESSADGRRASISSLCLCLVKPARGQVLSLERAD